MAATLSEYEWETLAEYEDEFELESEWEAEWESEAEDEGEAFFGRLASIARSAAPALRQVGLRAARSALGQAGQVGAAVGGAISPGGARTGQVIGAHLGSMLSNLLPQREYEGEDEYETNPIARIYPDVLMEHLGHAAAQTESEAEAEAFIASLVPVAARLAPQAARVVGQVAPQLTRGLTSVARTLRSSPATRQLVRTLPTIARNTVRTLAQQSASGAPLTPAHAAQTLARQTQRVIGNPQQAVQAYRRSRAMDQRYHRAAGGRTPARLCPRCAARRAARSAAREW
ncbi:MAG TPA: hypothetical protein VFS21_13440 [Roseiflexaceae bacterium]|nr:hypothetical protein [Roseiflexaceae bacterium]